MTIELNYIDLMFLLALTLKEINGLAVASVKEVSGLAIANVKSINGLSNVS